MMTFIYFTLSFATAVYASWTVDNCHPSALVLADRLAIPLSQVSSCSSQRLPGLEENEYYVQIANNGSSSHAAVVNESTGIVRTAPQLSSYHYILKNQGPLSLFSQIAKQALLAQNTKFAKPQEISLNCSDNVNQEPSISLTHKNFEYTWQIHWPTTIQCRFIQLGEVPHYTSGTLIAPAGNINIDPKSDSPQLTLLSWKMSYDQSYYQVDNIHAHLDWLKYLPRNTCSVSMIHDLKISRAALFNKNRWDGQRLGAIKLEYKSAKNLSSKKQSLTDFLSDPLELRPAKIILEARKDNNLVVMKGAWQVKTQHEFENLVYSQNEESSLRVKFRDLDCGVEYVSNWID